MSKSCKTLQPNASKQERALLDIKYRVLLESMEMQLKVRREVDAISIET